MITFNSTSPVEMEWSADGDNTDHSTSSSPNLRRFNHHDQDSLSEDDDFSDEFSIIDSDDDKRADSRYNPHPIVQVVTIIFLSVNVQ